ncbi:hypothetical protein TQ33_0819 [Kangiella geojedonensis]|uniref:Uncharacterized protein n=1 Tax=Kangiella geojedonensis TaxID=914150 RepID=A0A0F6RC76_9GAMM|nr:hypothetical protein TQ33_0819 [Kangiella geojedonensis]
MGRVDCVIKDWELVTFNSEEALYKVARGIIVENYTGPSNRVSGSAVPQSFIQIWSKISSKPEIPFIS